MIVCIENHHIAVGHDFNRTLLSHLGLNLLCNRLKIAAHIVRFLVVVQSKLFGLKLGIQVHIEPGL